MSKLLITSRLAGWRVVQLWSTRNTCPKKTLLLIDTLIFADGICLAGSIIKGVKKWVAMPYMNEWNKNIVILNRKTITSLLFG
jgi:hypothetical protein